MTRSRPLRSTNLVAAALAAVRSEWRLVAASHNLRKLHNHGVQPVTA